MEALDSLVLNLLRVFTGSLEEDLSVSQKKYTTCVTLALASAGGEDPWAANDD